MASHPRRFFFSPSLGLRRRKCLPGPKLSTAAAHSSTAELSTQPQRRSSIKISTFSEWTGHLRSSIQKTRRSEEHTSELQSLIRLSYAVFCLKKQKQQTNIIHH